MKNSWHAILSGVACLETASNLIATAAHRLLYDLNQDEGKE